MIKGILQFVTVVLVAFLVAQSVSAALPCFTTRASEDRPPTANITEHPGGPGSPIPTSPYHKECCQIGPTEMATQPRIVQPTQNEHSVQVVVEATLRWLDGSDAFGVRVSQDSASPAFIDSFQSLYCTFRT